MAKDLEERLAHQRAFWERNNLDRPVIGFTGSYFSPDTVKLIGREEGRVAPEDVDIERTLAYTEAQLEAWQDCTGDLFWTATQLYQFRWLAATVGAAVSAGGDSVWAEPFIEDYGQVQELKVTDDNPWLEVLWR